MKPTSASLLTAIALVAGLGGHALALAWSSRGEPVPVTGYAAGIMLLGIAAFVLWMGLRVKRYLDEAHERREHPSLAPRKHMIDMTQAYRIIMIARAAAFTGAVATGFFAGHVAYLAMRGGTLWGSIAPTGFASVSGLVLAVVGLVVQHWGTLPPAEDEPTENVELIS